MTSFQLVGLPYAQFAPLFELTDAALSKHDIRRVVATKKPGYPCRVSLVDAVVGEELLLLPFEHLSVASPYKSSGPIFVRKAAAEAKLDPGVIPDYVSSRLISVRAYDEQHAMTDAVVCAGTETAAAIHEMFGTPGVAFIHLHNANRGCFSCAVVRASERATIIRTTCGRLLLRRHTRGESQPKVDQRTTLKRATDGFFSLHYLSLTAFS
jgi:hypothetical protein